jgi:O-antigen/teichoic acid export membrane protein
MERTTKLEKMTFIKSIINHPLAKNFLVYSFGALFLKGISFFLLPLYTKLLSPAEYGVLDLLSTFANILDVSLSLGLLQVVMIEYYHYSDEKRSALFSKVISTFLTISTLLYGIALIVAIIFKGSFFPGVKNYLLLIVTATSYLTFFQSFLILVLRQQQKATRVTLLQIISGSVSIALNILFVYGWLWGVEGILWSSFIGVIGFMIYSWWYIFKELKVRYELNLAEAKALIKLGLPFVPNALALWLMSSANRWILLNYTNLDEVGYFSVAFKFSSMFDPLIIQPFLGAYTPRVLQRFSEKRFEQPLGKIALIALPGLLIAGFALMLVAHFMIDQKFEQSLMLIPILVLANYFPFMAQIAALILLYRKRIIPMVLSISSGAVAGVAANFILVPMYGSMGSAVAANIGGFVWFACIFALRQKEKSISVG